MSISDTKEKILDAAEYLFARRGFHNTSLRAITSRAGVNLAAVNYHFGSKDALLEAVFQRRLVPLNRIRRDNLEAVRETARREGRRPAVDEALRAFIEPTLAFRKSGTGAEDFITLVARSMSDPEDTVRDVFIRHIAPLFHLLFETLCEALPELTPDTVFWRLQFVIGAMGHVICMTGKNYKYALPAGVTPVDDVESLTALLIDFAATGLERP
ncbi:MAG: CerR family C-terminal domain-containing protein [Nitrospirae bacterium]|nr:CerR family C-terminal domain-containing protein [Nitrospirota bacterium]